MRVPVPFVGPSYEARSTYASAERALNCFVEINPSSRAPLALYGTPGLNKVTTVAASGSRAAITFGRYSWFIVGTFVYRVDQNYVVSRSSGSLVTGSGIISMASNGTEALIVDGARGYVLNLAGNSLTTITDVDFPNGVTQADYMDGYFIVTGNGTQQFYISELLAGGTWDGTDFASAEGSPDNTVGLIVDHREIWLFGSNSAEIWVNTGASPFPFERSGNTFIEHGCIAPRSIQKMDNTVFWLGGDDRGYGVVWRAAGYVPTRVSTHAIEHAIATYPTITDAYAFTYNQEGHAFYVLTFPSAGKTWVFDASTSMWHERAYRDPVTGSLGQWRPSVHCILNGAHLVGDYADGRIYKLDLDYFTDDGDPILRLRASQTQAQLQTRLFYNWLQVDIQTGVGLATGQGSNPKLMMRYSNNGGQSWSDIREGTIGAIGDYDGRCIFSRMGAGRNRVWEVSMTDPVPFCIIGAVAEGDAGVS